MRMHRKAELIKNGPADTRPEFWAKYLELNQVTVLPRSTECRPR